MGIEAEEEWAEDRSKEGDPEAAATGAGAGLAEEDVRASKDGGDSKHADST
jgi:hypothetical protein